jgi:nucleoporin GLE1
LYSPSGADSNLHLSQFLADDRNSEEHHRDALLAAQEEHKRVRDAAVRVYELHELEAERARIQEQERIEQRRIEAEKAVVAEELRLRELKKMTIPKPPPEPPSPAPVAQPAPKAPAPQLQPRAQAPPAQPAPAPAPAFAPSKPSVAPTPAPPQPAAAKPPPTTTTPLTNGVKPTPTPTSSSSIPAFQQNINARYVEIHRALKQLRATMKAEAKKPNTVLKEHLGTMRREIGKSVGQLTASGKRGENKQQVCPPLPYYSNIQLLTHQQTEKIMLILSKSLDGSVPSPPINPQTFVVDQRQPVEGAVHNGDSLPSLFIYLLNICTKAMIKQFITEGGVNTKSADPVGVSAALVFSAKNHQWRGRPLIDILICKFRVTCPVLFGLRGSEKTEAGRQRIGWRKDEGGFITESVHRDRMTGLGAGFASISLRHFNKADLKNPYPPSNYWKALAYILNTPASEVSNTQYVVLRAMLEHNEQRFLKFYGNAAMAALQVAIVEFPKKAPAGSAGAASVKGLGDMLAQEGLILA